MVLLVQTRVKSWVFVLPYRKDPDEKWWKLSELLRQILVHRSIGAELQTPLDVYLKNAAQIIKAPLPVEKNRAIVKSLR